MEQKKIKPTYPVDMALDTESTFSIRSLSAVSKRSDKHTFESGNGRPHTPLPPIPTHKSPQYLSPKTATKSGVNQMSSSDYYGWKKEDAKLRKNNGTVQIRKKSSEIKKPQNSKYSGLTPDMSFFYDTTYQEEKSMARQVKDKSKPRKTSHSHEVPVDHIPNEMASHAPTMTNQPDIHSLPYLVPPTSHTSTSKWPKTLLLFSILSVTIMPLTGLISVYCSLKTKAAVKDGQYALAKERSNNTKVVLVYTYSVGVLTLTTIALTLAGVWIADNFGYGFT